MRPRGAAAVFSVAHVNLGEQYNDRQDRDRNDEPRAPGTRTRKPRNMSR